MLHASAVYPFGNKFVRSTVELPRLCLLLGLEDCDPAKNSDAELALDKEGLKKLLGRQTPDMKSVIITYSE